MTSTWITVAAKPPFAAVFANTFTVANALEATLTYSADECCSLFLDGALLEHGPDHGDHRVWFTRDVKLSLTPGAHCLAARLNCYGQNSMPRAQITLKHGLFVSSRDLPGLDSGAPGWRCKVLAGVEFTKPGMSWGTGDKIALDGDLYPWDALSGAGEGWQPATAFSDARELAPSNLPPQKHLPVKGMKTRYVAEKLDGALSAKLDLPGEHRLWQRLLDGRQITVPPGRRRVIVDFDDYVCGRVELRFSKGRGAKVKISWAEAFFLTPTYTPHPSPSPKGDRDKILNKHFHGVGDSFSSDGGAGRKFSSFWWLSGRYLELLVDNPAEELVLEAFHVFETGHPYPGGFRADCPSAPLTRTLRRSFRTLEACAQDTYLDCPYFEQLMYIGDSRIEALCDYMVAAAPVMPERALRMLASSRNAEGMIHSRHPSWDVQIIPSFALIYCAMLHDYALWRDNPTFVASLLPTTRGIVAYFRRCASPDGLTHPPGWNFIDWVRTDAWDHGEPPEAREYPNSILNWFFVGALEKLAALEARFGDAAVATDYLREADRVAQALKTKFYLPEQGLFTNAPGRHHVSEHAQIAALLTDRAPEPEKTAAALFSGAIAVKPEISFTHYYFETCHKFNRPDLFFSRLGKWRLLDKWGLKTVPENFSHLRSDCHAWSSHPLYHYYATVLGVRPDDFGFAKIRISPQLGPLAWADGVIPHPKGEIGLKIRKAKGQTLVEYRLPPGVPAVVETPGFAATLTRVKGVVVIP